MKITKRERFLMREAMRVANSVNHFEIDDWLNESIDDFGNTVENQLSSNADEAIDRGEV